MEAPHITRQVQRLAQAGYAERPDTGDRRVQLTRLALSGKPPSGSAKSARNTCKVPWPIGPDDLHQLTIPFHRMVDEFLTYTAEYG